MPFLVFLFPVNLVFLSLLGTFFWGGLPYNQLSSKPIDHMFDKNINKTTDNYGHVQYTCTHTHARTHTYKRLKEVVNYSSFVFCSVFFILNFLSSQGRLKSAV